jgi:hypothetical protein
MKGDVLGNVQYTETKSDNHTDTMSKQVEVEDVGDHYGLSQYVAYALEIGSDFWQLFD